jgi:hypothetical protein
MITLVNDDIINQVSATDVQIHANVLSVFLSDSREISLPIDKYEWLNWLATATLEQQAKWSLEPNGFAIYWDELDNGIEISHLLGMQSIV